METLVHATNNNTTAKRTAFAESPLVTGNHCYVKTTMLPHLSRYVLKTSSSTIQTVQNIQNAPYALPITTTRPYSCSLNYTTYGHIKPSPKRLWHFTDEANSWVLFSGTVLNVHGRINPPLTRARWIDFRVENTDIFQSEMKPRWVSNFTGSNFIPFVWGKCAVSIMNTLTTRMSAGFFNCTPISQMVIGRNPGSRGVTLEARHYCNNRPAVG